MGKTGRLSTPRLTPTHWLQHLAFLAAVVLVVVVPLVWNASDYEVFRGPKRFLALATWTLLAALALTRAGRRHTWSDPWWLVWAGLGAGALLSAPLSGQPLRVLANTLPLGVVALGWGALRFLTAAHRRRLETLVVVVGVTEAILAAVFAVPRWQPEVFARLSYLEGRYAWIGTLGNPADVALFLLLPCLLATARAFAHPGARLRWAVPAAIMATAIVGSRTVTVLGVLGVGVAVLAWRGLPRRARVPGLAVAAALGLAVLLVGPMRARLGEVTAQLRSGSMSWLGSGRSAGYRAAVGMLAARPLTGAGFGLFEANSFRYQDEELLADRANVLGLVTAFGEAHNDLLQHAAETGMVGLALLLAGGWAAFRRARPREWALPATPILALAAGLITMTQFPFHQAALVAQWAVLAALAVPPRELPEPEVGWQHWVGLAAGATLVAGGWLWLWQLRGLSVLMRQGEALDQLLRAGHAPAEQTQAMARRAAENLDRAIRLDPTDWRARLVAGDLWMLAGGLTQASAHFDRALALAERFECHFNAGMVRVALGDRDGGLAHLERAVRLNPAVFRQITDPAVARALRLRLDASGYGGRHPWIFDPGPSATPPPQ